MDRHTEEDGISSSIRESHPCTDPETIEEGMGEYSDPRDDRDVIIVLVWIFMTMVTVAMIVMMWSEDFFYDIDHEESSDERIDSEFGLLERLRKDMCECDGEHRSSTESDEQREYLARDALPTIDEHTSGRDEGEYEEREEHIE